MTDRRIEDLTLQPVDPDSPIPLYYQVEKNLRELILRGELSPGDLLPPEMELARYFNISRHTIRMALSQLEKDNLIGRKAGRGTVVKDQEDRIKFYLNRSFTQQMADMGRTAHSEILEQRIGQIDTQSPRALHSKIGAPCLCLTRLRYGDSEPIGLQYTTVLTELCPGLERYDFSTASLYDVLLNEYRLRIKEILHTITAAIASGLTAEKLELAEGDPVLIVNTAALLEKGRMIEFSVSFYRADKYEYSTTHSYPG
jgi:GntR family transcriptional regulator